MSYEQTPYSYMTKGNEESITAWQERAWASEERIAELEQENAELRRYADERKDMIECAPGMTTGDVIKLVNEDRCQLFYLRPALEDKPACDHQWVDPTTEAVDANGHLVCAKCGYILAFEQGKP